jgi:hypothetical protein
MHLFLFPLVLFLFKLTSCKNSQVKLRKGYQIIRTTPLVNNDGSIYEINDKYEVYYLDDVFIYNFYYQFDSAVNGKNLVHESRANIFIYQKDSLWGQLYYPRKNFSNSGRRVSVDSILSKSLFENSKFSFLQISRPDSLYSDTAGNFVKVYNLPVNDSLPEQSIARFFYNKNFFDYKESLARSMDTSNNMKLFKIVIEAQGYFYKEYNLAFPKREYLTEVKEIEVENKDEILNYVNRYRNND